MSPRKKSQNEKKSERRLAIERKRKETGWSPPEKLLDFSPVDVEEYDELLVKAPGKEQIAEWMKESANWADEPEFESIWINPVEVSINIIETDEKYNLDCLSDLPEEQYYQIIDDIKYDLFDRLMTKDVQNKILSGLHDFYRRIERNSNISMALVVEILSKILQIADDNTIWYIVGLARAIFQRNLDLGLDFLNATRGVVAANPIEYVEQVGKSSRLTEKIEKTPGLYRYLEEEMDEVWRVGLKEILEGELYLGLFTMDEIEQGMKLAFSQMGFIHEQLTGDHILQLSRQDFKRLIKSMEQVIVDLITPEWLERCQKTITEALNNSELEKFRPFVFILREKVKDRENLLSDKKFLAKLFFGELNVLGSKARE